MTDGVAGPGTGYVETDETPSWRKAVEDYDPLSYWFGIGVGIAGRGLVGISGLPIPDATLLGGGLAVLGVVATYGWLTDE